ncbi:MAG: WD40/YVTN/BNR-like repeat-containing protein, partial [Bacteroidia bacterium]
MQRLLLSVLILAGLCLSPVWAQKKKKKDKDVPATEMKDEKDPFNAGTFMGLKWRSIGPATTSGRIADMAVNPNKTSEYYLATASGGVWKTSNGGTTYEPIFDSQGSYSIGCVTIDPSNPHTIWVGSGENNGQRSIAYGDGVYLSMDGGSSWKNMGLKNSEHIGNIIVHPDNSNVVYVAAHGPLWSGGGDRGLYKTTDAGKNWKKVLEVDEWTGVNEVHMDPRDPNIMYASSWQRARHVWTFLGGGPGSAIYKSTDGGETWFKSQTGIPGGDKGRIALAVSPVNPDRLFALVEAGKKSGLYRSDNRGANWRKVNSYITSGNYYQEIYCDPVDADKLFFLDTWAHVSIDGGNTVTKFGEERYKHVDNHCMWVDPSDTDHILMGCDGGLYETWDWGKNWQYKPNIPITQFYKVSTDNEKPFYYVYGGTQDNNTLGGPSRTTNRHGISNSDWFITNGGDGFEAVVDPTDPNTVYAQSQYGWLNRFDKASGEKIGIKPIEGKGEKGLRWNWDAPLIISPHQHTRLYFAANKLFRSDDRGNSWKAVSGDLTRQIDRNKLKIMGRQWGVDAINIHRSTTDYGNIVALDESSLKEGLLYVGTDDGLIQVSENGGDDWRKITSVGAVPGTTYVNMVVASRHNEGTVYAAFNNHKRGDFKPYIYKSTDKGMTWTSISSNLPERGSVYCLAEDHVDPNLLFAGTEFGAFFSSDGGKKWTQLKAGLPTVAVRDIDIQRRENDLVIASFGRGFYVLDDYSALRNMNADVLAKDAAIFPVKDALQFVQSSPLGYAGTGFQGMSYFKTDNPPVGAVFTYYLKEAPKTMQQERRKAEKKLVKEGKDVDWP